MIALSCIGGAASAQNRDGQTCPEIYRVWLPFAFDYPYLDSNFRDVSYRLAGLASAINETGPDGIEAVRLYSYASPQGSLERNLILSAQRLLSMKFHFLLNWPSLASKLEYHDCGEAWDLLAESVGGDDSLSQSQRAAVLSILSSGESGSQKKAAMEALPYYGYLERSHYRQVRGVMVVLVGCQEDVGVRDAGEREVLPEAGCIAPDPALRPHHGELSPAPRAVAARRSPGLAFRSNLLSDVAALPGVGMELAIGRHLSVAAEYQGAWWSRRSRDFFWQSISGDVSLRWWFGRQFTGHHVGIYGQAVTFDMEMGGRGFQLKRPGYGVGVEYGWALPLGRKDNGLSLDFEVGVGYISGDILEYVPDFGHYVWQQTTRFRWIGPAKAGISLIWQPRFGRRAGR